MILPGKGPFYRRWESTVKNIQNNIDVIASERREPQDVPVLESYIPLLNRGIEVRAILYRSEHNDEEFYLRIKQFQALLEYPNWKVRFSFSSQRPFVAVKDNSLAVITLDPTALFKHSRTLWTNNPSIVATVQHRFDTLWNLGQEYKP